MEGMDRKMAVGRKLAVAGTLARLCFSVNLWGLGAVNSPGTALDGNCILLNFGLLLIGQSRASAFSKRIIGFSRPYQWVWNSYS